MTRRKSRSIDLDLVVRPLVTCLRDWRRGASFLLFLVTILVVSCSPESSRKWDRIVRLNEFERPSGDPPSAEWTTALLHYEFAEVESLSESDQVEIDAFRPDFESMPQTSSEAELVRSLYEIQALEEGKLRRPYLSLEEQWVELGTRARLAYLRALADE